MVICKENLEIIFNAISAISSCGALVFAIIIASKISFKKEFRSKQLEVVFSLVVELQKLTFYFSYLVSSENDKEKRDSAGDIWYNFFLMNQKSLKQNGDLMINDVPIYVSHKFLFENSILNFISNPFLPQSIADKLRKLGSKGGQDFSYTPNQLSIYISDDREYDKHTYRREIAPSYSSMHELFCTCEEIKLSIENWLSKTNIKDLNYIKGK